MEFKIEFKTRWSDFDANIHMRHNAYNDYGAESRMRFFNQFGITIHDFKKDNVGPILFEEYTSFRKEIHLGEDITVTLKMTGLSKHSERWKMQHDIYNSKGELSAIIKVYGAWIDMTQRKLIAPPEKYQRIFKDLIKSDDFEEIILKNK